MVEEIDDLQPIPRDSEDKGLAAMLVPQTKEVNSFVQVHQHGRRDVACKCGTSARAHEQILYCAFQLSLERL